MIVTTGDFIDKWTISIGFGSGKLQEYIDQYEPLILAELLGAEFADEIQTQFDTGTLTPENQALFDKIYFNANVCGDNRLFVSEGIATMLKDFIYSHYQVGDLGTPTSEGKIKLKTEGGKLVNDDYTDRFNFYNSGVKTYKAIQKYIEENKEDYPLYKGIEKTTTWLI